VSANGKGTPLLDLAAALPEHLALGAAAGLDVEGLPSLATTNALVILGMGAGRTVGRLVQAVGAATVPIPIVVESSYDIPACVGQGTMVFALSGSGNTDEVNHAAKKSLARGAKLVAVSAAGYLVELARDCRLPIFVIPPEIRPARAAFGVMASAVMAMLKKIGFLPQADHWIAAAISQLRRRRDDLVRPGNVADALAAQLIDRHLVLQGDAPIGATAAERWKAQFNQNARQMAFASVQPDASHNEVMAWDFHAQRPRPNEAVVLLRHGFEYSRASARVDQFAAYLSGKIPVYSVRAEGTCSFSALMDLAMVGDFTSLHVAERRGIDPMSVPEIVRPLTERFAPPEI
jgi:glucose/mannose-6-phosphate isomerase